MIVNNGEYIAIDQVNHDNTLKGTGRPETPLGISDEILDQINQGFSGISAYAKKEWVSANYVDGDDFNNAITDIQNTFVDMSGTIQKEYAEKDWVSGNFVSKPVFDDTVEDIQDTFVDMSATIKNDYVEWRDTDGWDITHYSAGSGINISGHQVSMSYDNLLDIRGRDGIYVEEEGPYLYVGISAFPDYVLKQYYKKTETSGKGELTAEFGNVSAAIDYVSAHVGGNLAAGTDLKIEDDVISVNTNGTVANSADMSFVAGNGTSANGQGALAIGTSARVVINYIGDEPVWDDACTVASGIGAVAFGMGSSAVGDYSFAEGALSYASGKFSHAEGGGCWEEDDGNTIYYCTIASGEASHAEGMNTTANAEYSHAEGVVTQTNGPASHAEGANNRANGTASHAEGQGTSAIGNYSHAEGRGTIAGSSAMHVGGTYNKTSADDALFVIGNGTAANNRSDAFIVTTAGLISATTISTSGISDIEFELTNIESDLTNNYYNKTEIDNKLADMGGFKVTPGTSAGPTLPATDADKNFIYLVDCGTVDPDRYSEWIVTVENDTATWTCVGDTSLDLSDYAPVSAVDELQADIISAHNRIDELEEIISTYSARWVLLQE